MSETIARLGLALDERYHLQRLLAEEGEALVLLAEDRRHARPVALKVFRPRTLAEGGGARFLREVTATASLQHPHILPLLDSGESAGCLWFTIPWVEGETLRERLDREGPIVPGRVIRLLVDMADALVYAHARGVAHLALAPETVVVSGRHAFLSDFGVARALSAMGEPGSDEAASDPARLAQDQAADIRALGALGVQMLTGRPAAGVPDPASFPPSVPAPLVASLQRCLTDRPEERWPGAAALLAVLEGLVTPSGGTTPVQLPAMRRRRLRRAAAGAGGAVLLGALGWWTLRPGPPPSAALMAEEQLTFDGKVREATIAPDGRMLAVIRQRGDSQDLLVQDLGGGAPVLLTTGRYLEHLSWTGNGSSVVYSAVGDDRVTVHRISRLGGAPQTVATQRGELAPDGRRYYVIDPVRKGQGTVLDLEGGPSVDLTVSQEDAVQVERAWSPDGSRLGVLLYDPAQDRLRIVSVDPRTGAITLLVPPDSTMLAALTWAPGGRAIYYLREAGTTFDVMRLGLTARGRPDGVPTLLRSAVPMPRTFPQLGVSRDGRLLTYVRQVASANLQLMRLGSPGRALAADSLTMGTANYLFARFAPDGHSFAVIREETEGQSLNRFDLSTRRLTPLARFAEGNIPAWSPDGEAIAATVRHRGGGFSVLTVPARGGAARSVGEGRVGNDLDFAPAGGVMAGGPGNHSIVAVDTATGADRVVFQGDTGYIFNPRPHPDGRQLAFYWNRPGLDGPGVWYRAAPGEPPRKLVSGWYAPLRWAANGKEVYVSNWTIRGGPVRLMAVDPAAGTSRVLARLPESATVMDISPDGTMLLVRQEQRVSDAWLIRDFDPAAR